MARRTGRAKPMTAKAGVTKTKRRYACGGKMKKWWIDDEEVKADDLSAYSDDSYDNAVVETPIPRIARPIEPDRLSWE